MSFPTTFSSFRFLRSSGVQGRRGGGGDDDEPRRGPPDKAASDRHAQMRANKAEPVHLTCSVNEDGLFEIRCPKGFDPDLWLAARSCIDALSGQGTSQMSQDDGAIILAPGTPAKTVNRYLEAGNASISLLFGLGLSAPEAAMVLKQFPGIVSFVNDRGPTHFKLHGTFGGKPPIAKLPPELVVQFGTLLIHAGRPEACCNLLAACGTKSEHLRRLVLSRHVAALAHWSGPKDRLVDKLKQISHELRREAPDLWRGLVTSHDVPPWIVEVLTPPMPEGAHAKEARKAAEAARKTAKALLSAWMLGDPDTDDSCRLRLRLVDLLGEGATDLLQLRELACVLADEPMDDGVRELLAQGLTHLLCDGLEAAWGAGKLEFFTEIPQASDAEPYRSVLPLLRCVLAAAFLGPKALAIFVPMLADIEKHRWRETERKELEVLLGDTLATLWQVQEQFPEIEVESARLTLISILDSVGDGLGIPYTPSNPVLLDRRAGCEEAKQRFKSLATEPANEALLSRRDPIMTALAHALSGQNLDMVEEIEAVGQKAILKALLKDPAWLEFVEWMAGKAGYDVLQAWAVSLLGPTLRLTPTELFLEIYMAKSDLLRFALSVTLCPLVSTLPMDRSAEGLIKLLATELSYRHDAPTLYFEACAGSRRHRFVKTCDELIAVCTVSRMYSLLVNSPMLPRVLGGGSDALQQCARQFLESRADTKFSRWFPMIVFADLALRFDLPNAKLLKDFAQEISSTIGFQTVFEYDPKFIHDALHGATADRWRFVDFCILTSQISKRRAGLAVEHLCSHFWSDEDNTRLRAAIFGSKLSPLPGTSLEAMSEEEKSKWKKQFTRWLSKFSYEGNLYLRACALILSQLADKGSEATIRYVMEAMEKEANDRMIRTAFATYVRGFRAALKEAGKRGQRNEERTVITLPSPGLMPVSMRRQNVPLLTKVGEDVQALRGTISKLIEEGLFFSELQLLAFTPLELARPNLLLALLFRAGLFDRYQKPPPELLAWLGGQCCTWPTPGREFVAILSKQFSAWTRWHMVDPEQLAAFMSGVLQSTLDYLSKNPGKHIKKIGEHVTHLVQLFELLMDKCLSDPERSESEPVRHCLALLESLKASPGAFV